MFFSHQQNATWEEMFSKNGDKKIQLISIMCLSSRPGLWYGFLHSLVYCLN